MTDFYAALPPAVALELEQLTRLSYELREHHTAVLGMHAAASADELLQAISAGRIGEHPAYEHYLAARALDATRGTVRDLIARKVADLAQP